MKIIKVKAKILQPKEIAANNYELQAAIEEVFRKQAEFIKNNIYNLYNVESFRAQSHDIYEYTVKERANMILKSAYEVASSNVWKL